MRVLSLIGALAFLPVASLAQDWVALTGSEIQAALSGKSLIYEGATQDFYASGRTLYDAGQPSWGYWRVEAGKYCSQWPPGQSWDCYQLEQSADGKTVRFLDPDNRAFVGTYAP